MSNIIIGIHGLSNKPAQEVLEKGWKEAIEEGLLKNEGISTNTLNFTSVYWADILYKKPDSSAKLYKKAKKGALKTYKETWVDSAREKTFSWAGEIGDVLNKYLHINEKANELLKNKLPDLYKYYTDKKIKKEIRSRLKDVIQKHKGKRVMILSHSMGTIIAYDVLRELGKLSPRLTIDHFVTLGSPLGLPHVTSEIIAENPLIRTPSIVTRWSNFADKRDPVAIDVYLSGDFEPNDRGVQVKDDLVANDWDDGGLHHKSYGYLRTPEVSKVIKNFI